MELQQTLDFNPERKEYKASYFNTTGLSGEALRQKKIKAGSLVDEVLDFFSNRRDKSFTPWEVHDSIGKNRPITSVRRAVSNLVEMGRLEYTGQLKASGPYSEQCKLARFKNTTEGVRIS